jgi:hypothetical protein
MGRGDMKVHTSKTHKVRATTHVEAHSLISDIKMLNFMHDVLSNAPAGRGRARPCPERCTASRGMGTRTCSGSAQQQQRTRQRMQLGLL